MSIFTNIFKKLHPNIDCIEDTIIEPLNDCSISEVRIESLFMDSDEFDQHLS